MIPRISRSVVRIQHQNIVTTSTAICNNHNNSSINVRFFSGTGSKEPTRKPNIPQGGLPQNQKQQQGPNTSRFSSKQQLKQAGVARDNLGLSSSEPGDTVEMRDKIARGESGEAEEGLTDPTLAMGSTISEHAGSNLATQGMNQGPRDTLGRLAKDKHKNPLWNVDSATKQQDVEVSGVDNLGIVSEVNRTGDSSGWSPAKQQQQQKLDNDEYLSSDADLKVSQEIDKTYEWVQQQSKNSSEPIKVSESASPLPSADPLGTIGGILSEGYETAKDKVSHMADSVKATMAEMKDNLGQKANQAMEAGNKKIQKGQEKVKAKSEQQNADYQQNQQQSKDRVI